EGLDSTLLILQNRLEAEGNHPDIQVIKEYGNLPKVECYPGQLNQVFMNILNNSIDSLKESMIGCHLLVDNAKTTSNQQLTNNNPQIRIWTEVLDSSQVIIRIADNGCGMTEAVKQKIFDPFFTTKPVGSGTGLG
ncbi:MAG: sensor histidine kinase, partial [Nostoc sp.]